MRIFIFSFIVIFGFCTTLIAQIPTVGLIAYYPFNGNADDESGNGNNGTIYGASLTFDKCGRPNQAYLFNGTSDYISLNPAFLIPCSQGTFAAWVKLSDLMSVQYLGCIADENTIDYYISFLRYDPNYQRFTIFQRYPGETNLVEGSTLIEKDKYYFVAMTSDGNEWKMYVNGEKESLTTILGNNNGVWASGINSVDNLLLGCIRINPPFMTAFLNGSLDEVRFYNRSLSDAEILQLYYYDCILNNIVGDSEVCKGQVGISYSVQPIDNVTYTWSYSGTGATINGNTNTVLVDFSNNATNGDLIVTITGENINTQSASIPITLHPLPLKAGLISGNSEVCRGQSGEVYTVPVLENATLFNWNYSGTGATLHGNSNGITIDFANNASSGNISVTGLNACGIGIPSDSFHITLDSLPSEAGLINGKNEVCLGKNGEVYNVAAIENAALYDWHYSGTGASIHGNSNDIEIDFSQGATSGSLFVSASNDCGSGITSEAFSITLKSCSENPSGINIPNSFSPNNDGINDVFFIRGLNENSTLMIFDRTGKEVFKSSDYNNDWDGKDKQGNALESETYWYVLAISGIPSEFKGYVYLKR